MIPMVQGSQNRHVVGFQHVKPRRENIGQLTLMNKDSRLAFAHSELCAVFDLVGFTLKAPNHCVTRIINPVNNIDELAAQKIKNTHEITSLGEKQIKAGPLGATR